jgi:hypothetical protein
MRQAWNLIIENKSASRFVGIILLLICLTYKMSSGVETVNLKGAFSEGWFGGVFALEILAMFVLGMLFLINGFHKEN